MACLYWGWIRAWTSGPRPSCTPKPVARAAPYAASSTVLSRPWRSGTTSPCCTRTLITTSFPRSLRCRYTPASGSAETHPAIIADGKDSVEQGRKGQAHGVHPSGQLGPEGQPDRAGMYELRGHLTRAQPMDTE